MINVSRNIAWSIAEIEASAAGFQSILPNYFWAGCCKGCDLDLAKFLREAKPEIKELEGQIAQDFKVIRDALAEAKPSALRRALRVRLGKNEEPTPRPVHRHPDLRGAFAAGKHLAEIAGGSVKPVHVLYSLLQNSDPLFDECLESIGGDRKALTEALETCVLAEGFSPADHKARAIPAGDTAQREHPAEPKKRALLSQFGRDLNRLASDDNPPLIGRKPEMLKIAQTLLQIRKNNVILVGEPGVGKTGIAEGLAQRIVQGKVAEELKFTRIVEKCLTALTARLSDRGTTLYLSPEVVELVAKEGFSPEFGARVGTDLRAVDRPAARGRHPARRLCRGPLPHGSRKGSAHPLETDRVEFGPAHLEPRRRNRMSDIQQFKNERLVGESHDGLVMISSKSDGAWTLVPKEG